MRMSNLARCVLVTILVVAPLDNTSDASFSIVTSPLPVAAPSYLQSAIIGSSGCVATIADLRALRAPPFRAVHCTKVLGYHAPGDGGGGDFYWDGISSAADDGGIVFRPDSNPTSGRWKRLIEDRPVSVTWFGATGRDNTDDTAAIQAAIDYSQSTLPSLFPEVQNTAALHVPAGTYHIGSSLRIQNALDFSRFP